MHDSVSAKPNSRAAEVIPRSRSCQRSRGKCKPIHAATKSLSWDNCTSDAVRVMPYLSGCLQCPVQCFLFFQGKKLAEVVNKAQTVFEFRYTFHILEVGQNQVCRNHFFLGACNDSV